MSHPSSSISSEKTTDEYGWAWHAPTPARGHEGFTTPSFGSQSNGRATQRSSSHLMSVVDGWVFLIWMTPIERALTNQSSHTSHHIMCRQQAPLTERDILPWAYRRASPTGTMLQEQQRTSSIALGRKATHTSKPLLTSYTAVERASERVGGQCYEVNATKGLKKHCHKVDR